MEKYQKIVSDFEKLKSAIDEQFPPNKDIVNYFYVEEKIDGSQIRGEVTSDGSIMVGSKEVDFDDEHPPDKMFTLGVERMLHSLKMLYDKYRGTHIVLFGEYLAKPKHNTIHYEKVPDGNVYLFDAKINGKWANYNDIYEIAAYVGFQPVCVIKWFTYFPNMDELKDSLEASSVLGGQREGVVIKNRDIRFQRYNQDSFFAVKVVNKQFKELNKKVWEIEKKAGVRSIDDLADTVVSAIQTQALWNKAIYHLRESGQSEHSMRDIPKLMELLEKDIEEELSDSIKEQLYKHMYRHISKRITGRFPVYYKGFLVNELAEGVKNE